MYLGKNNPSVAQLHMIYAGFEVGGLPYHLQAGSSPPEGLASPASLTTLNASV